MAQPIVTRTAPYCAACYAQHPDRVHVDYRSAIEGRLLDPSAPRGRHIDWVIICEGCLRAGVALLPEETSARDAAAATEAALRDRVRELEAYTARLEDAVAARPARGHAHPTVTPYAPGSGSLAGAPVPKPKRRSRYGAQS